jgi:hypothetical protein
VVSPPPATEEIGAMGREIESRKGIALKIKMIRRQFFGGKIFTKL